MSGLNTVLLGEVLLEARSGFACGNVDPDGVPQFRMNNVARDGSLDYSKLRRVPREKARLDTFALRGGDVLFNATNSPDLVGKTALFIERDEPTVFSNHFLRLRAGDQLDSSFLARYLQMHFTRGTFRGMCRQWVNQATVGREAVLGMEIPLPPIEEQRRIAAILNHADALRVKRREALARLDELTQSIFIDMFGDALTCALGESLDFVTSGGRGWSKYYADEGDCFIRSLDVRMNRLELEQAAFVVAPDNAEARRTRTVRGDVLLTITGSRIGRAATVPIGLEGSYVSQHVAILRPKSDKLESQFLSSFLCHPQFGQVQIARLQYGQTKPGLNFEQIRSFEVPAVSLSLQRDFVGRNARLVDLRSVHLEALARLDSLFSSLQSRAFRGEL